MTVTTMLWATNGTGDGTSGGYTDVQTQRFFRQLLMSDPTVQGIIAAAENELAPSVTDTSEITVATGAALIYGLHLNSDAATVLTLPTVAGDTGGIVWAGIDWTTQTGEVNVTQNTAGNPAIPALVQTNLTEWQIPICSYVVDSAGAVWTTAAKTTAGVTDLRRFVGLAGLRMEYRQGGSATVWNTAGTTNRVVTPTPHVLAGAVLTNGSGVGAVTFPSAFATAPLILASPTTANHYFIQNVTAADFEVETWNADGTLAAAGIVVNWWAIGIPA